MLIDPLLARSKRLSVIQHEIIQSQFALLTIHSGFEKG